VIFIGKPHYAAEWHGTSIAIEQMGILPTQHIRNSIENAIFFCATLKN